MTETYTVRFQEYQEYSIERDEQMMRLLASTNRGTWHAAVPIESAGKLRERRQAFRTYVYTAMSLGLMPREVDIGECMEEEIGQGI